ncbi:MAG: putative toxin-antitoxin system toxin component, PIN family [Candidatus Rokubacteria bacterium]|nr:putative toxin-antitoxin system toxin component, PIN family [Candidatus Rokubacteria bacterium]
MTRRSALPALKVVLDTQLLLRGALARTQSLTARLYEAWRADQFVLLVSEPILAEVDAVTARPELWRKLRVTPREARAVPRRLRRHAVLVQPDVTIRTSRDPRDDKFLECAEPRPPAMPEPRPPPRNHLVPSPTPPVLGVSVRIFPLDPRRPQRRPAAGRARSGSAPVTRRAETQ